MTLNALVWHFVPDLYLPIRGMMYLLKWNQSLLPNSRCMRLSCQFGSPECTRLQNTVLFQTLHCRDCGPLSYADNISICSVAITTYVMGKCTTFAMRLGPTFLLEVSPVQLHFSEFSSAHSFCVCFVGWNGICPICNLLCSVELGIRKCCHNLWWWWWF